MRVSVAIARAGRGAADIDLPLVYEFCTTRNGFSWRVARPAILINHHVTCALGFLSTEVCSKAERSERTDQLIEPLTFGQQKRHRLPSFNRNDFFENRQPFIETNEDISALF